MKNYFVGHKDGRMAGSERAASMYQREAGKMRNLDCMDESELWIVHTYLNTNSRKRASELFNRTGPGTVKAMRNCAHYAANKATAMACRRRGEIQTALMYEGICERIYATLPDFARW